MPFGTTSPVHSAWRIHGRRNPPIKCTLGIKSALGKEWKTGEDGTEAHAPTTAADFHIIPKNY